MHLAKIGVDAQPAHSLGDYPRHVFFLGAGVRGRHLRHHVLKALRDL
jgi:hypothetical protein